MNRESWKTVPLVNHWIFILGMIDSHVIRASNLHESTALSHQNSFDSHRNQIERVAWICGVRANQRSTCRLVQPLQASLQPDIVARFSGKPQTRQDWDSERRGLRALNKCISSWVGQEYRMRSCMWAQTSLSLEIFVFLSAKFSSIGPFPIWFSRSVDWVMIHGSLPSLNLSTFHLLQYCSFNFGTKSWIATPSGWMIYIQKICTVEKALRHVGESQGGTVQYCTEIMGWRYLEVAAPMPLQVPEMRRWHGESSRCTTSASTCRVSLRLAAAGKPHSRISNPANTRLMDGSTWLKWAICHRLLDSSVVNICLAVVFSWKKN